MKNRDYSFESKARLEKMGDMVLLYRDDGDLIGHAFVEDSSLADLYDRVQLNLEAGMITDGKAAHFRRLICKLGYTPDTNVSQRIAPSSEEHRLGKNIEKYTRALHNLESQINVLRDLGIAA